MAFHDTLLCDEYTQDGSLGVVDEDVVGAAASVGGAFGGCRAGVGGVAGGADAPLREGGLRLRRRRTTRPVHLLHAETCWSGRSKYVPASLVAAVRARLVRGEQVAEVLTGISAINAELLARRELI